MKRCMAAVMVSLAGCATAPPIVTQQQQRAFDDVVRQAEMESASVDLPEAERLLRQAKDEFDYGQRTPLYPERERAVLAKAQKDAETALAMARREHQRLAAAGLLGHRAVATTSAGPAALEVRP